MAAAWPKNRRLIGKKHTRLDGPAKATGRAKYSYDINLPGMFHAVIVRCPHPHAKITAIDTAAAEKVAGFKALHLIVNVGGELFYAGDEVLAVAADTEEHALDCARAVKVTYQELPFLVHEEDAIKNDQSTVPGANPAAKKNLRQVEDRNAPNAGAVANAFQAEGTTVHEGTYGMPVISHQCLESHGLVAQWNDDQTQLTVYASTQATTGTAEALRNRFGLPAGRVRCVTHFMGGGFGSKFGPDVQGITAAELAKKAKAPVKLMLDRADEVTAGGNRPSTYGKVKIAGTKDGTITAYEFIGYSTPGIGAGGGAFAVVPYVYEVANVHSLQTAVRLNRGNQRAMRAPRHPQSCYVTDCAIDDLAAKLKLDPLEVRLKNIPKNQPGAAKNSLGALRHTIYTDGLKLAAEKIEWKKKWHPPGETKGPVKHGVGMALHTWGGQASSQPGGNDCTVLIAQDGSVTPETSTQDLGTAQRTVTAIVVAEVLGLKVSDINMSNFGESQYGRSSGSGGSTTCPSQAPAALIAATAARDKLFAAIAPKLGAKPEDLSAEDGQVVDKGQNKKWPWKEACAKLGMEQIKEKGNWIFADSQKPENAGVSNGGVGGVQAAEVLVDTETGVVRVTRIVAVQDCGLIINLLGCETQVAGGVIMGLNYALFEENIFDRHTGRQVNPDMEFYKLGGLVDMPKIDVIMMDMPERGVIGIGEPPTISTHAAIGNAIFNAIGVRVPWTPFTPDRVLAALAGGK